MDRDDFDPAGFVAIGRELLANAPNSEAAVRAACGRAYYAVYGLIRIRLCRAKGIPARQLFGRAGRHGDLINALEHGAVQFKRFAIQYRHLHNVRVRSDYSYSYRVGRHEAKQALDDANWIVSRLPSIPDTEFRSLPLMPR